MTPTCMADQMDDVITTRSMLGVRFTDCKMLATPTTMGLMLWVNAFLGGQFICTGAAVWMRYLYGNRVRGL